MSTFYLVQVSKCKNNNPNSIYQSHNEYIVLFLKIEKNTHLSEWNHMADSSLNAPCQCKWKYCISYMIHNVILFFNIYECKENDFIMVLWKILVLNPFETVRK